MTRTLLIDGDVEVFKAASVNQEVTDWGDDSGITVDVNQTGAEDYLVPALDRYRDALKADRLIVCLTDKDNWRKKLWPDYKANRKDIARPLLWQHCRDFLWDNYKVECWSRLEADDVMGILSTTIRGSVIVSVDKDMKTIPCRLYNPDKPEDGVQLVDDVMAHEWHMQQALMGDATDGFKGCPGVGKVKAARIVREVFDEINPIQNYSAWRIALWKRVVNAYLEKELTGEDALMNARLAYILRKPGEYNRQTAKIRLWRPPTC